MSETTSVAIFATGGAGINQLKRLFKGNLEIPEDVKMCCIDTSESNLRGLEDKDIPFIKISSFGSGKDRSTNADLIYDQIEKMDITEHLGDINIILSSLAGGSGSIIANMLAVKCANLNKTTISMCVIDTSSQKSCENSINAIRSYDNMAKKYNLYFPVMLYNNDDSGRRDVDTHLVQDLEFLIELFDNDIEELDHRDKIHFLNPNMVDPSLSGIYSLGIVNAEDLQDVIDKSDGANNVTVTMAKTIHAVLCVNANGKCADVNALVDYIGISDDTPFTVVNGVSIDTQLTNKLKLRAEQFRNRTINSTNLDSLELENSKQNNGLIL